MSQLSLVIFTVLAQAAVGIFIALGMIELMARPERKAMTKSFIASFILLGIGAVASTTHLSQPLRMFNVLLGVQHGSALSLEIVALSLFGGAGAAYMGMRLFNLLEGLQKLVLMAAMVLGVVLILAIANVYTLETVPVWDSIWTPFQFLMTAAVAGPLGAATLLRVQSKELGSVQALADKALATVGTLTVIVASVGYVGYLFWLGQLDVAANPFTVAAYPFNLPMLRMGLLLTGILSWSMFAARGSNKCSHMTTTAFVMVMASELLGRAFFYDAFISASAGM